MERVPELKTLGTVSGATKGVFWIHAFEPSSMQWNYRS
jgi:hypothetical protein